MKSLILCMLLLWGASTSSFADTLPNQLGASGSFFLLPIPVMGPSFFSLKINYARQFAQDFSWTLSLSGQSHAVYEFFSSVGGMEAGIAYKLLSFNLQKAHGIFIEPTVGIFLGTHDSDLSWKDSFTFFPVSLSARYRYQFDGGFYLQAGIRTELAHLYLPIKSKKSAGVGSLALPRIELGYGLYF